MNTIRQAKKSKIITRKINHQEESAEELAKQKLIEFSNVWDLTHISGNGVNENP